MGNINYFGKSLKASTLFGGQKTDRSDKAAAAKIEKDKKA